jgi:predicted ATP-grasp superfamily ATP-dependent carboligase
VNEQTRERLAVLWLAIGQVQESDRYIQKLNARLNAAPEWSMDLVHIQRDLENAEATLGKEQEAVAQALDALLLDRLAVLLPQLGVQLPNMTEGV